MLQARDSYYSGKPLIVDDMFDKVEVRPCDSVLYVENFISLMDKFRLVNYSHVSPPTVEAPVVWFQVCCEVSSLQLEKTVCICRC